MTVKCRPPRGPQGPAGPAGPPGADGTGGPLPVITMITAVQSFTASGTFDPAAYPGLQYVRVRAVAGGGGSSGIAASPIGIVSVGQNGAGGTYAESLLNAADIGTAPVAVTVGTGGTGTPAGGENGHAGTGDPSSFGTLVVASNGPTAAVGARTLAGAIVDARGINGARALSTGSVGQTVVPGESGGDILAFGPNQMGGDVQHLYGTTAGGRSMLSAQSGGSNSYYFGSVGGGLRVNAVAGFAPGGGASAPLSGASVDDPAQAGADGATGVVVVEVHQLTVT